MFDEMMEEIDARPDNFGSLRDANAYAKYKGPCGDTAEMWLRIDGGRIRKASFMTDGCTPSVACCSAAARLVEGMKPEKAKQLSQQEVLDATTMSIPPDHHHCALLAATTIQMAVLDFLNPPPKPKKRGLRRLFKRNPGSKD